MRRGVWHQFGDKSQRFVIEQLQQGNGDGVILSPRDLSFTHATEYARRYHGLRTDVLIDLQFYRHDFVNDNTGSYPLDKTLGSTERPVSKADLTTLTTNIVQINQTLASEGIIAPALVYEAGRDDIVRRNALLFQAAKRAGNVLGIPTYATVIVGRSAISSDETTFSIISHATALDSAGFYFGFEFEPERIPSDYETVLRCCTTGLVLANSGLPVMHAFAGPMALLSPCFGATATAIGHYQNTWRFDKNRWVSSGEGRGGGGRAPARLFSGSLWGTIIYPDEFSRFSAATRGQVLTTSPFLGGITVNPPFTITLSRWQSLKHLIYVIGTTASGFLTVNNPRNNATNAIEILNNATMLHEGITIPLADNTNGYQRAWSRALQTLLAHRSDDFDYYEMIN